MPDEPVHRAEIIARLSSGPFDVLIIGGGIVGAGIARDAVLRGLRVALVEQGDFAGGASSKTSKLIHGGLRYLEHGHLGLVHESLRERAILRKTAPNIVKPLSILLPVYRGDARSAWKIRVGLALYRWLAGRNTLSMGQMLKGAAKAEAALGLRTADRIAIGAYQDCLMDDARLCLSNILQASAAGAVCANQVRVQALLIHKGRVCGAAVEDRETGNAFEVESQAVVNAAGPWSDRVRRMSDNAAPQRLSPTKGIHLVLPPLLEKGLFVQAKADGRMLFLLPWMGQTLIGTTESLVKGPLENLRAEADEAAYLLEEARRVAPDAGWTEKDVVGSFAGARPLLGFTGRAHAASREHRIEEDEKGLISVMGGKYTTFRKIAQDAVDALIQSHSFRAKPCTTKTAPLLAKGDIPPRVPSGLSPEALGRLVVRYGSDARRVLALLEQEPVLAAPVCPHHPYLLAELVHAIRYEMASDVGDLLIRRTPMLYSACRGLDGEAAVRSVLQRYLDFSESKMNAQWKAYRQQADEGLAFRSG